jgi:hypothetical protein
MECGIIFWGVSVEGKIIFLQQKRIFRIMTGSPTRTTCKMFFQKLKILALISQHILSLMRFLSSNLDIFTFNSSVHNINTRLRLKLHKPLVRLKMYQWSSYYNCINIYNKLPDDLANLILNKKLFLPQIKKISDRQALLYTGRILEHSIDLKSEDQCINEIISDAQFCRLNYLTVHLINLKFSSNVVYKAFVIVN